jgi:molybdopterin molybdotransferase
VIEPVAAGLNVRRRGEEARAGVLAFPAGHRLGAADVGALMALGAERIRVVRRPRVAIFAARVTVGEDANGPMLAALAQREGAVADPPIRLDRDWAGLRGSLAGQGPDMFVVTGGTGEGSSDRAAATLAEAGSIVFPGVALLPGETTAVGLVSGTPVALLPGEPAACRWGWELVAAPIVRRLGGRGPEPPYEVRTMRAARKFTSTIGYATVAPVRREGDEGVVPLAADRRLGWADRADGFTVFAEESEGCPEGAPLVVYLTP